MENVLSAGLAYPGPQTGGQRTHTHTHTIGKRPILPFPVYENIPDVHNTRLQAGSQKNVSCSLQFCSPRGIQEGHRTMASLPILFFNAATEACAWVDTLTQTLLENDKKPFERCNLHSSQKFPQNPPSSSWRWQAKTRFGGRR